MTSALLTAWLLGLAGSSHCVGMCGGIACALGLSGKPDIWTVLGYQLGRIAGYGIIGLLLGAVFAQLMQWLPALTLILRTLAGCLLLAMALYSLRWWQGVGVLEQWGAKLWRPLQQRLQPLIPASALWRPLGMGLLWGWLPCGLVYSTLAWAVAQSDRGSDAALLMLAFGLGTLPAMFSAGFFAQQLRKLQGLLQFRLLLALLLVLMGGWTLWGAWQHAGHAGSQHDTHHHHTTPVEHDHHLDHSHQDHGGH